MDPLTWSVVVLVILAGIGGVIARERWVRLLFWIQAAPPLCVGAFTLYQGGIAEGFAPKLMTEFCTVAFWPTVGCALGEYLAFRRRGMKNITEDPA
jgi:hypothetical protein